MRSENLLTFGFCLDYYTCGYIIAIKDVVLAIIELFKAFVIIEDGGKYHDPYGKNKNLYEFHKVLINLLILLKVAMET